jgi:hypothetical protein
MSDRRLLRGSVNLAFGGLLIAVWLLDQRPGDVAPSGEGSMERFGFQLTEVAEQTGTDARTSTPHPAPSTPPTACS